MVTDTVSSADILELEERVKASFRGATQSLATALEVLWAIKEGELWKNHLSVNGDGQATPVFSNFATEYLPHFLRDECEGLGYSKDWVLAKFRLYTRLVLADPDARFEDVLRIKNAYAVEKLLELDKTEGKLMLTGQGAASEGAAKQLLRDAVSGDLDLASFQQEVGTGQIQWVVEAGTRNIWCRVPGEGDFPLGDEVKYWSARAWLSLEAKLKPQQIETGVE